MNEINFLQSILAQLLGVTLALVVAVPIAYFALKRLYR